jgi:hypothetical protein
MWAEYTDSNRSVLSNKQPTTVTSSPGSTGQVRFSVQIIEQTPPKASANNSAGSAAAAVPHRTCVQLIQKSGDPVLYRKLIDALIDRLEL